MSARDLFTAFFKANEANIVVDTAEELFESVGCWDVKGIERYDVLKEKLKPELPFKGQRLFEVLDKAIKRRDALKSSRVEAKLAEANVEKTEGLEVVISGAGPCGLRAAVECLLLGMKVTVLEKRTEFSRVNILMTWQQTIDDLVGVGAKYFYPQQKTHGKTHMGTREMQLCLLKTALLLGGSIHYGVQVTNIRTVAGFDGAKTGAGEKAKFAAVCVGLNEEAMAKMKSETANPLGFKKDKRGDYEDTFKCNMMFSPTVDYELFVPYAETSMINKSTPTPVDEKFLMNRLNQRSLSRKAKESSKKNALNAYAFEFDALILAEGEWSKTSSKLGFEKTVDKFKEAIGMVINLEFNPENKVEKKLREYNVSKINADWRKSALFTINEAGMRSENIEYLRGTTHYIVITVDRHALAKKGVLKDVTHSPVLDASNVDKTKLYEVAREISTLAGLPKETPFTKKNPVQIFDFSTRARAVHSHLWLTSNVETKVETEGPKTIKVSPDQPNMSLGKGDVQAPVFPIGDTLFEPFWPQGLGSNRGFHGALDTAFALLALQQQGAEECSKERKYSYFCMNLSGWRNSSTVNPEKIWNADPINRYRPDVLTAARNQAKFEVPQRLMAIDFKRLH